MFVRPYFIGISLPPGGISIVTTRRDYEPASPRAKVVLRVLAVQRFPAENSKTLETLLAQISALQPTDRERAIVGIDATDPIKGTPFYREFRRVFGMTGWFLKASFFELEPGNGPLTRKAQDARLAVGSVRVLTELADLLATERLRVPALDLADELKGQIRGFTAARKGTENDPGDLAVALALACYMSHISPAYATGGLVTVNYS